MEDVKADRLLAILLRLDTERRVTAAQLAAELEVHPRTIGRDLEALSSAGVPVVAERGANGGWFLLRPYHTDLSGLSPAEASSLFLPIAAEHLSGLGFQQDAASGRTKLQASITEQAREQVKFMQTRVLVDTPGWQLQDDALRHLSTLQVALRRERQLRFIYRRMTGESQARELDPYGLIFRGGRWYVLGKAGGLLRTFRVDRISDLEINDQESCRPADFDLKEAWLQARRDLLQRLPEYVVMVQISESDIPELSFNVRFTRVQWQQAAPELGPDIWRVGLLFDTPEAAFVFVLGFGIKLWVEDPLELRVKIVDAARSILHRAEEPLTDAAKPLGARHEL